MTYQHQGAIGAPTSSLERASRASVLVELHVLYILIVISLLGKQGQQYIKEYIQKTKLSG